MPGWIKIFRDIMKHWIFNNEAYFKAWITMIMTVNHETKKVLIDNELIQCERGQSLKSLNSWVDTFGKNWSIQKVRTFFKLLNDDGMIIIEGMRKTTKITICNYYKYQNIQQTDNTQITHRQQTDNTQITTNKNDKELKNEKNEKNNYKKIFDYYQTLNLIKHKNYTKTMSEAIRLFIKNTKSTEEECMEALKKHSSVVENSKKEEYPIKARTFSEFFGQKVFGGKELIGEQYINGGKYFNYTPKKVIVLPEYKFYVPIRERAQNE